MPYPLGDQLRITGLPSATRPAKGCIHWFHNWAGSRGQRRSSIYMPRPLGLFVACETRKADEGKMGSGVREDEKN